MKRRYTTAAQIIKAIDKCHASAQEWQREAEKMDAIADALFKFPEAAEEARGRREEASRMRLKANNLVNKRAKKLGEKLSEFCTGTMCILPDNSIPVA